MAQCSRRADTGPGQDRDYDNIGPRAAQERGLDSVNGLKDKCV